MARALGLVLLLICSETCKAKEESQVPSGRPLRATRGAASPLATGVDSFPIGVADIFGGPYPDLFVISHRHSGPYSPSGLILYRCVGRDPSSGVPRFERHSAIGLGTDTSYISAGAIAQTEDGTVHGVFLVAPAHGRSSSRGGGRGEGAGAPDPLPSAGRFKHSRRPVKARGHREKAGHRGLLSSSSVPIVLEAKFDLATSSFLDPQPIRITRGEVSKNEVSGVFILPCMPKRGPSLCGKRASGGREGAFEGHLLLDIMAGARNFAPKEDGWLPYTAQAGWRGGATPFASLYDVDLTENRIIYTPTPVTGSGDGVPYSYCGVGLVNGTGAAGVGSGGGMTMITGSFYGGMNALRVVRDVPDAGGGGTWRLERRLPLRAPGGSLHVHPTIHAYPVVFPGIHPHDPPSLIVGGEGAVYYYHGINQRDSPTPAFGLPSPVVEEGAELYGGSLTVPNLVDWDGDGRLDIVTGNSEGRLLVFRNIGKRTGDLQFSPGEELEAGGEPLVVRQFRPVQGPQETGYGYTCPAVADWNGDGLPDVLLSDATYQHRVFLNRGTAREPRLSLGRLLMVHGTPLLGGLRVKPAVLAVRGGHMAYVAVDGDDRLHAYYRLDDTNLEDAGPLQMAGTGAEIRCSFRNWAGSHGRISIVVEDWDMDGVPDLLLGTHQFSAVPEPESGLPKGSGAKVLFLKGEVGGGPLGLAFRWPEEVRHGGAELQFGSHKCSPAVLRAAVNGEDGPHLLVGEQGGRFIFLQRSKLSTASYPRFPPEPPQGGNRSAAWDPALPASVLHSLHPPRPSSPELRGVPGLPLGGGAVILVCLLALALLYAVLRGLRLWTR